LLVSRLAEYSLTIHLPSLLHQMTMLATRKAMLNLMTIEMETGKEVEMKNKVKMRKEVIGKKVEMLESPVRKGMMARECESYRKCLARKGVRYLNCQKRVFCCILRMVMESSLVSNEWVGCVKLILVGSHECITIQTTSVNIVTLLTTVQVSFLFQSCEDTPH